MCPLTELENRLRSAGGQDPYGPRGCVEYWLHRLHLLQRPAVGFHHVLHAVRARGGGDVCFSSPALAAQDGAAVARPGANFVRVRTVDIVKRGNGRARNVGNFTPANPRGAASWVGDAVMATPALRALREQFPDAHISYLLRRYVKPIYAGMPWADKLITYRTGKTRAKAGKGPFDLAARLRAGKFDLAMLLPNSFKSALICKMAGIDRIVGYERDGRGFLLTDKLLPVKERGKFIPTPIVKYYLGLSHYLGATHRDLKLQLFVTESERREAQEVSAAAGSIRDRPPRRCGSRR
jgi:hypothetical protein